MSFSSYVKVYEVVERALRATIPASAYRGTLEPVKDKLMGIKITDGSWVAPIYPNYDAYRIISWIFNDLYAAFPEMNTEDKLRLSQIAVSELLLFDGDTHSGVGEKTLRMRRLFYALAENRHYWIMQYGLYGDGIKRVFLSSVQLWNALIKAFKKEFGGRPSARRIRLFQDWMRVRDSSAAYKQWYSEHPEGFYRVEKMLRESLDSEVFTMLEQSLSSWLDEELFEEDKDSEPLKDLFILWQLHGIPGVPYPAATASYAELDVQLTKLIRGCGCTGGEVAPLLCTWLCGQQRLFYDTTMTAYDVARHLRACIKFDPIKGV